MHGLRKNAASERKAAERRDAKAMARRSRVKVVK
jgi:hypothetical protein